MTRSVVRDVRSIVFALLAIAWLAGCDEGSEADAGPTRDAAAPADAGAMRDASADAGASDGGVEDAGSDDAGSSDAGAESDASTAPDAAALGPEPGPGDLVIVEIQGNPQVATDLQGEYIELLNVSGRTLNLEGCRLKHWNGLGPITAGAVHLIDEPVVVAPGARVLLGRSSGGHFGGATLGYVYDGFVFGNGGTETNLLRVMAPGWDGTEPPSASSIVDQVTAPAGTFDNDLRGRAWQLDPDRLPAPSAAGNDDADNWCHAAATDALAYRASNWGTPAAANRCD